jgi:hypothetical protein
MQRAVLLAIVAGVIVVGSLAVAVALPRYPECAPGWRLLDTSDAEWTDETAMCENVDPLIGVEPTHRSLVYEIPDRQGWKVGIAAAGVVIGASLAVIAFALQRRDRRSAVTVAEAGG